MRLTNDMTAKLYAVTVMPGVIPPLVIVRG